MPCPVRRGEVSFVCRWNHRLHRNRGETERLLSNHHLTQSCIISEHLRGLLCLKLCILFLIW